MTSSVRLVSVGYRVNKKNNMKIEPKRKNTKSIPSLDGNCKCVFNKAKSDERRATTNHVKPIKRQTQSIEWRMDLGIAVLNTLRAQCL